MTNNEFSSDIATHSLLYSIKAKQSPIVAELLNKTKTKIRNGDIRYRNELQTSKQKIEEF